MAFRKALEFVCGSTLIYVAMAACSASDVVQKGGGGGVLGSGSASGSGSDSGSGSILNPVPDADAAESGTRLKVIRSTSSDGYSAPAGTFDSALGFDCSRQLATDGVMRCLPVVSTIGYYFADDACTIPAAVVPCGDTGTYISVPSLTSSCSGGSLAATTSVHKSSGPLTEVYLKPGDSCYKAQNLASGYMAVGLETATPPTEFVELSRTIDE